MVDLETSKAKGSDGEKSSARRPWSAPRIIEGAIKQAGNQPGFGADGNTILNSHSS